MSEPLKDLLEALGYTIMCIALIAVLIFVVNIVWGTFGFYGVVTLAFLAGLYALFHGVLNEVQQHGRRWLK